MLKILRDRFIRLGRDEEGVALVVTLGIFMFLYVVCASVYAVGMAVKEKLHLQGACDAAAYSAAIVQADTFSRIATINRAMSWTYQQMTRRQMDYIVWQWLEEVIEHHKLDREAAKKYAEDHSTCADNAGGPCSRLPEHKRCYWRGHGWDCSDISLESKGGAQHGPYTEDRLRTLAESRFEEWLRRRKNVGSFYSQSATLDGLGRQIDDDLRNIYQMSEAVDDLARGLPRRVDDAVEAILQANIPAYMTNGACLYFIKQADTPRKSYFRTFKNNAYDEMIFLSYDDSEVKSPEEVFKNGINTWFVIGDGRHDEEPQDDNEGKGLHRSYDHTRPGPPLRANWTWWATGWKCGTTSGIHWSIPLNFNKECSHSHPSHDKCKCSEGDAVIGEYVSGVKFDGFNRLVPDTSSGTTRQLMNAYCSADSNQHPPPYGAYDNPALGRYDNRFKGHVQIRPPVGPFVSVYARPLKLKKDYFGTNGTITVGLARRNENPWFSLFGRVTGGIYSAFSPLVDSWSYCFASAKAGYKLYHEPRDWYANLHLGSRRTRRVDDWEEKLNGNVRVANGPRDYCIDWKEEQTKFAGWYRTNSRVDGQRVSTLVTEWTAPEELYPTWRQSWNLVQDDWDAVMVPVRQGGARAEEVANYSLLQWWQNRLSGQYGNLDDIPDRHEPAWLDRDSGHLASLVNGASWRTLSGSGVPDTDVMAGPTATGTGQWNIGKPGDSLDWSRIGDEMYH